MKPTHCCYLETLFCGKWQWMGTFYNDSMDEAKRSAVEHLKCLEQDENRKYRVIEGEPKRKRASADGEPRVKTLLRFMLTALEQNDYETYWRVFDMLLSLHKEMLQDANCQPTINSG